MNYLLAAGGTGQEIVSASLRLGYLAGLNPPKIRVIDSDLGGFGADSKAKTRTQVLRRLVSDLEDLGPAAGINLDFLNPAASPTSADTYTSVPDVFGRSGSVTKSDQDLLDLLLDDSQQRLTINDGFHGEPAVGALVFSSAMERGGFNGLFKEIREDAGAGIGARIVFAGSIAGGVGTAVVPVLMKRLDQLRTSLGSGGKLRILSLLQVPWFQLVLHSGEGDMRPADVRQEMFDRNSTCLVKGYLSAEQNKVFEKMVLLGLPNPVHRLSQGGDTQKETTHFLNILSGIYTLNLQAENAVERMCGTEGSTFAAPELDVDPPAGPLGSGGNPPMLYLKNGMGLTIKQLTIIARCLAGFTRALLFELGDEEGRGSLDPSLTHTHVVARTLSQLSVQEREAFRTAVIRFHNLHNEIVDWFEKCLRSEVQGREVFVPGLFEPEGGRWDEYFSIEVSHLLRELGVSVFLRNPPVNRKIIQYLHPSAAVDKTAGGKKAAWALLEQVRTKLIERLT